MRTTFLLLATAIIVAACGEGTSSPLAFETYEKEADAQNPDGIPAHLTLRFDVPQGEGGTAACIASGIRSLIGASEIARELGMPDEVTLQEVGDRYGTTFTNRMAKGELEGVPAEYMLHITHTYQNAACVRFHIQDGIYGNGGPYEYDAVVRKSDGHVMTQSELVSITQDNVVKLIKKYGTDEQKESSFFEDGSYQFSPDAEGVRLHWATGSHFFQELVIPVEAMEPYLTEEGLLLFTAAPCTDAAPADDAASGQSAEEAASEQPASEVRGELGLFELQGPVKSCKVHNRWDITFTRTFDEQGFWLTYDGKSLKKIYPSGIKRDGQGRIVSGVMDADGNGEDYAYNADGLITTYSYHYFDTIEEDTYTWEDGKLLSKRVEQGGMDAEEPFTETYELVEVDAHGNWTKRIVKVGSDKSTETREITYYE